MPSLFHLPGLNVKISTGTFYLYDPLHVAEPCPNQTQAVHASSSLLLLLLLVLLLSSSSSLLCYGSILVTILYDYIHLC